MKTITVIFVIFFCLSLGAQSDSTGSISSETKNFFVEVSADPVHPSDVRGGIGYRVNRVETQINYEYYQKTKSSVYQETDFSLYYDLVSGYPIFHKKTYFGFGSRAGFVNDGMSSAAFLRGTMELGKRLKVMVYANYCTADRWRSYPELRIALSYRVGQKF